MIKKKKKLIQLNRNESVQFRKKWWEKQGKRCALLKKKIPFSKTVVDHKHKLKKEKVGIKDKGLVRGIIDHQTNAFLGKVENAFKRYRMDRHGSFREVMEMVCDYIEKPPMPQKYIHWKEKPKAPTFGKRDYNLVKKYYFNMHPRAKKIPEYPKKPKNTKRKNWRPKRTTKWDEWIKKAEKLRNKNVKPIKR